MYKKQQLVWGCDFGNWANEVNRLLKDGWVAVPNCISATVSVGNMTYSKERYAIVLEKEEKV